MCAQGVTKRVLKVGLVQDGQLTRETLFESHDSVTVGQESSNAFALAELQAPSRHRLFEPTSQGYRLVMWENMQGRLLIGDRTEELSELCRSDGRTRRTARGYELDLEPRAKGSITIGRSTLLFQFVPPPPPPTTGRKLPKELKANLLKRADYVFIAIILMSAMFHTGALLYINGQTTDDGPVWIVQPPVFNPPDGPIPPEVTPPPATPTPKGPGGLQNMSDNNQTVRGAPAGTSNKPGLLQMLTTNGPNGMVGELTSTGLNEQLDDILRSIGGVRVARSGEQGGLPRGDRGPGDGQNDGRPIGDIGSLGSEGTVGTGDATERKVRSQVTSGAPAVAGMIDQNGVSRVIRSRLGAIRNCYEIQLKLDSTIKGTLRIAIAVSATGEVVSVSVLSNTTGNAAVAECVCQRIRGWRFPPAGENTAEISQTFVFTPVE